MHHEKILQAIKNDLEKENLDCFIEPFDAVLPKRLLIYTGEDKKQRTQIIEIKVLAPEFQQTILPNDSPTILQFDLLFPFIVQDNAMSDVAQFLHFLNLQVDVPGFHLDYLNNHILYRYVHFLENDHLSSKILISLVGRFMIFQDIFAQTLERLAEGKVSFLEIMREIQEMLDKAFPKNP